MKTTKPEKITLFYTGDDVYGKTGSMMSSIYHVGTFERSDWGEVTLALNAGREVRIRQANKRERVWLIVQLAKYAKEGR